MPRVARIKSNESIYHVMCRSISEVKLLKDDEDKLKYLDYIRNYQKLHKFNVYGYCLMDNHVHLMIDSNGADISQIMHGINFSYARYFNRKYKRHGHLFQDRFKSKVINTDGYLITASAYIHNNATDVEGFKECPENYEYSSLAVYLGLRKDPFELIDSNFILALFGNNFKKARGRYYQFVFKCDNKAEEDIEFENEGTLYTSQRTILARNIEAEQILDYVSKATNTPKTMFYTRYNRKITKAKALLIILLKNLCNFSSAKICSFLGDVTQANISRLAGIGLEFIKGNEECNLIFKGFYNLADVS
jgi:putative transposase